MDFRIPEPISPVQVWSSRPTQPPRLSARNLHQQKMDVADDLESPPRPHKNKSSEGRWIPSCARRLALGQLSPFPLLPEKCPRRSGDFRPRLLTPFKPDFSGTSSPPLPCIPRRNGMPGRNGALLFGWRLQSETDD